MTADARPDPREDYPETVKLTAEEEAARKRRNRMIALSLIGFIGLIFLTTVIRLGQNIASGSAG